MRRAGGSTRRAGAQRDGPGLNETGRGPTRRGLKDIFPGVAYVSRAADLASIPAFPVRLSDRLVGLVVKASASRVEDPGFESRLRRDFFGVESYQ